MRSRPLQFLSALTALAALPLAAQQGGTAADTTRLGATVVTATRTPLPRDASTAAVTVLSGADLRARGVTRLSEALREVPGASIVQTGAVGSTTSLFLRGGESRYVKVLVDGVPVNEAGGAFDFSTLSTDNVERVEVVRGPASVLYGSDAVTGVIQIFTRDGGGRTRGTLALRGGSYGTFEGSGDAQGAAGPLRWSAGLARHQTSGILAFNNDWDNVVGSLALATRPSAKGDVRFTARFGDATFHSPTDFSGAVTDSNAFTDESRLALGLDAGRRFGRRLEGRVQLTQSRVRRLSSNLEDSPGDTLGFISTNRAISTRRVADARANLSLADGVIATLGAEYQHQEEDNEGTSRFARFPASATSFEEWRDNRAGYAQLLLTRAGASATIGARRDDNRKFGTFDTWRAAASYLVAATGTKFRASSGTSFREPAFNEVFNTSFSTGNAGLRPERARSWELGVTQSFPGLAELGVTRFDQTFTDRIEFIARPGTQPDYDNLAEATATGWEIEARLDEWRGLGLAASWTALETEVTKQASPSGRRVGLPLLRRPNRTASVTGSYRVSDRGRLALTAVRTGDRVDTDFSAFPSRDVVLARFTRLDLSAEGTVLRAAPGRPAVTLTFHADNLLDEEYQLVHGFEAPGRMVRVGVRVGY